MHIRGQWIIREQVSPWIGGGGRGAAVGKAVCARDHLNLHYRNNVALIIAICSRWWMSTARGRTRCQYRDAVFATNKSTPTLFHRSTTFLLPTLFSSLYNFPQTREKFLHSLKLCYRVRSIFFRFETEISIDKKTCALKRRE